MSCPVPYTCPSIDLGVAEANAVVDRLEELREANDLIRQWGEEQELLKDEAEARVDELEGNYDQLQSNYDDLASELRELRTQVAA